MQADHTVQHQPLNRSTLPNADWAALRLLNLYRLFLLAAFAAVFYLSGINSLIGSYNTTLFMITHLLYLIAAISISQMIRCRRPALESQFYLHVYIDIILLSVLMHTSGGIQSGLGILLIVPIGVLTHCAKPRYAFLFASISTVTILSQEIYTQYAYGMEFSDFPRVAMVGAMLFIVALLTSVILPAQGLDQAPENRPLSVRQITELNRQIIQELESGVMFIDNDNYVQLVNETGKDMLSMEGLDLPEHIGKVCDPLFKALAQWRRQPAMGNRSITLAAGAVEILPCFTRLDNGGTLVKLEDHRQIRQQVQQLKLASLGRLSASIAHEIRNPLGAISNAVQLLGESESITDGDSHLLDIAHKHTGRINRIVEDVLLLSSRQSANKEAILLQQLLDDFRTQFQLQNRSTSYTLELISDPVTVVFDSLHLDQILWNLCTNSLVHNEQKTDLVITISTSQAENGALTLEIRDNGRGIDQDAQQNLFEPFFTTKHTGTGLGLYIIRELCELNHALIEYDAEAEGACFRIFLPQNDAMAA